MSDRMVVSAIPVVVGDGVALRFDGVAMTLHWLTAVLVVTLFALAQVWGLFPRGDATRHALQSLHISLGLLLTLVVVGRVLWRTIFARPMPPAGSGPLEIAARGMHFLLYGLLLLMIVAGFGKQWVPGHPLSFFGLVSLPPPVAFDPVWRGVVNVAHEWGAWTIIVLAGLHAAAALFHHYVLRDDVLRRMLPGRRIPAGH